MLPNSLGRTRWEQHTLPCRVSPRLQMECSGSGSMGMQNELGRTHPTPSAEASSI